MTPQLPIQPMLPCAVSFGQHVCNQYENPPHTHMCECGQILTADKTQEPVDIDINCKRVTRKEPKFK